MRVGSRAMLDRCAKSFRLAHHMTIPDPHPHPSPDGRGVRDRAPTGVQVNDARMNMQQKFYWLFGGILALLVLASLIGWILQRRALQRGGDETIANLNARVRAWWVMVAIIATNFLLGRNATVVL